MSRFLQVKIDAPTVTKDEAVELMTHHLLMAAAYYEAAPDGPGTIAEAKRIAITKGETPGRVKALMVWVTCMDAHYATLRREQGD